MTRATVCLALVATMLASTGFAGDADRELTLGDALTTGDVSLTLRYRLEAVEQPDLFDKDAFASTLRTTLAYRTGRWQGLEVFLELEDVHEIGVQDHARDLGVGSGNGVTDRPVIADPEGTEVNQAAVIWSPTRRLRASLGRQEILIDTHRFVGNVGWRQNHQSFDAARLDLDLGAATTASYAYIGQVHRVFGDSLPMSSHVVDIAHTLRSIDTMRAYAVLLDYDDIKDASLSRSSYGASFDGRARLGSSSLLLYRIEHAWQRDSGDNPHHVDAEYSRADLGLNVGQMTFNIGYEVLGGSPKNDRFLTPLATLHKFNGFADLFLVTPPDGLKDLLASIDATLGAWKLTAIWHDLSSDSGSSQYGQELDLLVVRTLPWKQTVGLKGAFYEADELAVDTHKVMLWTQWGF